MIGILSVRIFSELKVHQKDLCFVFSHFSALKWYAKKINKNCFFFFNYVLFVQLFKVMSWSSKMRDTLWWIQKCHMEKGLIWTMWSLSYNIWTTLRVAKSLNDDHHLKKKKILKRDNLEEILQFNFNLKILNGLLPHLRS